MLIAGGCTPLGGCLVYDVASAPVKVAVGTAEVAGGVAVGTAKVAGSVAAGTIKLAAGLARSGAVTFVDVANNNQVSRVPWRQGLTLAAAGDAAKVPLTSRAVNIVRDGKIVFSSANGAGPNASASIAAGDVVQLSR
jgi:hypothetical protein